MEGLRPRHGIEIVQGDFQGFRNADKGIHPGQAVTAKDFGKGTFVDGVFIGEQLYGAVATLFNEFSEVFPDFPAYVHLGSASIEVEN